MLLQRVANYNPSLGKIKLHEIVTVYLWNYSVLEQQISLKNLNLSN